MLDRERRRFSRVEFHAPARLQGPGVDCEVELLDISMRGVLIQAPMVEIAGTTKYTLLLPLSEKDAIEMEVEPVHWRGGVVGMQCERIDVESIVHLRRLLEANLGDVGLVNRELHQLMTPVG